MLAVTGSLLGSFIYSQNIEIMQHSFIKRIQGHELTFNRNPYPSSYNISITEFNENDHSVLTLLKDEKGIWTVSESEKSPVWFNEISLDIHYAIEKNEENYKERLPEEPAPAQDIKRGAPQFPVQLSCLY